MFKHLALLALVAFSTANDDLVKCASASDCPSNDCCFHSKVSFQGISQSFQYCVDSKYESSLIEQLVKAKSYGFDVEYGCLDSQVGS